MNLKKIILIRHAESDKSIQNRHGGNGMPLTSRGIAETKEICTWLKSNHNFDKNSVKIFSGSVLQAEETAKLLHEEIGVFESVDDRLRNIDLGVLAGLSEEEALIQHPEAALSLEKWRQGLISIEQVVIPNAESMYQFHFRVKDFLEELFENEFVSTGIIVVTRSVAVAITNILLGHHKYNESGYKRYSFDPSSISIFNVLKFLLCEIEFINQTAHLSIKPAHPDK